MTEEYSVFYNIGSELKLQTKATKARLLLNGPSVRLVGSATEVGFTGDQFRSIAVVRPHKVGTVIKIDIGTDFLFLAVTRLSIGQFALLNYIGTMRLFQRLSAISAGPSSEYPIERRRPRIKQRIVFWTVASVLCWVLFIM
ncbi:MULTISPECIES: hypothetical protein [unclassified Rhizobium]|uniref:hypothetical protein n=1 Tax=unclassified Rhizobium TaxID=2613769 RepID=UPI002889E48C|nr:MULTISPECIES: hypothetical protein [unclassified Rhizobium]